MIIRVGVQVVGGRLLPGGEADLDAQAAFGPGARGDRAGDWLSALLYNKLRLAKEIQLNMWSHFCVRTAKLAGGRPRGGITIHTRWVPWP